MTAKMILTASSFSEIGQLVVARDATHRMVRWWIERRGWVQQFAVELEARKPPNDTGHAAILAAIEKLRRQLTGPRVTGVLGPPVFVSERILTEGKFMNVELQKYKVSIPPVSTAGDPVVSRRLLVTREDGGSPTLDELGIGSVDVPLDATEAEFETVEGAVTTYKLQDTDDDGNLGFSSAKSFTATDDSGPIVGEVGEPENIGERTVEVPDEPE